MHIGGEGTTGHLAAGVRKVMDKVKEVRAASARPVKTFGKKALSETSAVTAAPLAAILGQQSGKPAEKDGMDAQATAKQTEK